MLPPMSNTKVQTDRENSYATMDSLVDFDLDIETGLFAIADVSLVRYRRLRTIHQK
jgi:hypothetical protein